MTYLVYGIDTLVKEYIDKIIKDNKIDDINISRYESEDSIANIIEDASTISLFADKKVILVENHEVFTTKYKDNISSLENYIKSNNTTSILIFYMYSQSPDSRKKIYKVIKEYGKVVDLSKSLNIFDIVKKYFNGYSISNSSINLLIDRVGNDLNILKTEAEKLKIYKIDTKIITDQNIIDSIRKRSDVDIFKFIDNIITKNKKEVISVYKELIKIGEEPIKIIVMLSNQFRLMYQAKHLTRKGYSEDDISSLLGVKRYPVHLAITKGYKYDDKTILKYLEELADLDIKIKSGDINKYIALELFLLKI